MPPLPLPEPTEDIVKTVRPMNRVFLISLLQFLFCLMMLAGVAFCQSGDHSSSATTPADPSKSSVTSGAKPLLLEKDEGEVWSRRPHPVPNPASQIMLKVSPHSNGSQHMVVGTETIPVNGVLPVHKHTDQDELLLIDSGIVHVSLGGQERDLHAGGLIFVPTDTWVGMKNISSEAVAITFIFGAPGFDQYVRCTSVLPGEKAQPLSQDEWRQCQHDAHAVFQGAGGAAAGTESGLP